MGIFLFALVCALHLYSLASDSLILRRITKPFIIPSLFYAMGASSPILIAVAFFYTVGDVFMLFAEKSIFLTAGALCFACGHLLYGSYFLSVGFSPIGMALALLCHVVFITIMVRSGRAGVKEVIYLLLLGMMTVPVFSSFRPEPKALVACLGAALFIISDSMIVLGQTGVRSCSDMAVMTTYIAANFFLLLGI